jgi:uncharacterized protein YjbI with pentapeptide repeats
MLWTNLLPWWGKAGLVIFVAVILLAALREFWWQFPKRHADSFRLQIRKVKDRADLEDAVRKSVGQLIGGIAVLAGAAFAYFQFTAQQQMSQSQIDATYAQLKGQQETAQRQLKAAHDQLISQQVSKGFEQLGSKELSLRLGGIYALEGVMNASERYHKPVLEALCAFVRDETRVEPTLGNPEQTNGSKRLANRGISKLSLPATDIQATLTVIGRREYKTDQADLRGANIPKADLTRADLAGANLSGANLTEANLNGADLGGADLKRANLTGANLNEANLAGVSLSWANTGASKLNGVDLKGANLEGVDLNGAELNGANLEGADLWKAKLKGAKLNGVNLKGAKLVDADLNGAELNGANLEGANLWRANLNGASLMAANLNETYVEREQLKHVCGDKTGTLTIRPTTLDPAVTIAVKSCPE